MKKFNKGVVLTLVVALLMSMLTVMPFAEEVVTAVEEVVVHAVLDEATPYSVLDETYVRYLGRGEIVAEKGRSMNWPMSGIEFTFTGTTAEVEVVTNDKDDNYRTHFNVSVDGGEPERIMLYTGWNTICSGLEEGTHTVKFVRSSEGIDSQLYMSNIRTDSEEAPVPTDDKSRRIEFLADSYACGYGNLPELVDNIKCAKNTDAWQAYPAYIARHFDADLSVVAVSGKGVCMNYATKVTKINDTNVMPQQFLSADVKRGSEVHQDWDFENNPHPQVLVIYLGTNDYNGSVKDEVWGAGSNPEYFVEKYEEMLGLIREKYPQTHILCVSKPFQCYHEELSVLIEEMAKSDDKLHRLVLEEFHASAVHGHPNVEQHQQTAGYIIDAIEAIPDVWGEGETDEVLVKENQDRSIDVFLNGTELTFDVEPIIVNDRTLVPMRAIFEALGATVSWDDDTQTASAVKDEITIDITIGGAFKINGEEVELDVDSQLVSDRTMVPLRAISEGFGCAVDWEGYELPWKDYLSANDKPFTIFGHRGASAYAPENTMDAFHLAIEQRANGLETDVRRTKDGVLVLFHDDDMEKLTGVKGSISDYTYEQLSYLDVIGGVNNDITGKIPTLEEFLQEFSSLDITFAIELKQDGIEQQTVDMLDKYNMHKKRTEIISFEIDHLRNVNAYTKRYQLGYIIKEYTADVDQQMAELGISLISPRTKIILDRAVVEDMQAKGYTVQSWGAYIEKSIKYTYDLGVDAMVVDYPDILFNYMNETHNTDNGDN